MSTAEIEIPRYSVVRVVGGVGLTSEFVCAQMPNEGDEPNEDAIVMFSGRDEALRFIAAHDLQDWVPAFIGYRELRDWLAECLRNRSRWAVVDFHDERRPSVAKAFRIADAITAIDASDASDLETGEPISVKGQSLMM